MSTIVTFLIVGGILAFAARAAISEADNGATSDGQSRRDRGASPYRGRIRGAAQALGRGSAAAGSFVADRARRGRERLRSKDRSPPEPPVPDRDGPDPHPVPSLEVAASDRVVAPAGAVLVGETVGEPVERVTPTPARRVQSFAELVVLIGLLGLAVAAVLAALVAVGGRALDDFVG